MGRRRGGFGSRGGSSGGGGLFGTKPKPQAKSTKPKPQPRARKQTNNSSNKQQSRNTSSSNAGPRSNTGGSFGGSTFMQSLGGSLVGSMVGHMIMRSVFGPSVENMPQEQQQQMLDQYNNPENPCYLQFQSMMMCLNNNDDAENCRWAVDAFGDCQGK